MVLPAGFDYSFPCYEHQTLADLLGTNHITWKYYAPAGFDLVAPTAISHICGTSMRSTNAPILAGRHLCQQRNLRNHQQYSANLRRHLACNLAAVTWVIPDKKWGTSRQKRRLRADYVGSLVDVIGQSPCTNPGDGKTYWNSPAIFIVWDDWGGWYDHVNPNNAPGLGVRSDCGTWGCGYTYGFRVPLLVVSPYTGIPKTVHTAVMSRAIR